MKAVVALAVLIIGSFAALSGAEPSASIKKTVEVYGTKTATSIAVRLDGEGIKKPGIYHLPSKTELRDAIAASEISHISNGRFHVTRKVDGYERQFEFQRNREKEPQLPSFELLEGDFVYAGINLP